ncbi:unnamed protein product [Larinioides sclopetarius]|uniref:SHSP domain-containing protein n=1 Tax=Larinioides sclopetarius TaxID=280406 RepID=A0AAV1ZG17_9ARAC
MDQEIKVKEVPAEQKQPKDQETNNQETTAGQDEPSIELGIFSNGGLIIEDPHLVGKLREVVVDDLQQKTRLSQGTQTGRYPSTPIADAKWKEQAESTKRELLTSAKIASDYFDGNSRIETASGKLKDQFTILNAKIGTAIPEDFKIYVDCKQFQPSEVKVNSEDGFIVVHARHQHKFDDHGMVKREFKRRWPIPEDVKKDKFVCLFDRYNVLTIRAPRKPTTLVVPVQIEKSRDYKISEV